MEFSDKQTTICYLDQYQMYLYEQSIGKILQIDFQQGSLSDQELINKEKLEESVVTYLENNKVSLGNITIIYSRNFYIEKEFGPQAEEEIQKFLDAIPFEESLTKIYDLGNKQIAVAINKKIHDALVAIFRKKGYAVIGAIPSKILQEVSRELSSSFDLSLIAARIDFYKQFSFTQSENTPEFSPKTENSSSSSNRNILLLSSILIMLLSFLLIIIFFKFFPGKKTAVKPPPALPPAKPTEQLPTTPIASPSGQVIIFR